MINTLSDCAPSVNPHLSPHQGQDVHLPGEAVFHRGHYQTGATENNLALCPLMQLRLALPDTKHALQQGPLLLVCNHWTFWNKKKS